MKPRGKQIAAARSLAGWTREDLAKRTGLGAATIKNVEGEAFATKQETFEKIITAFRNIGIEFTENDGVRRAPMGIETFEGRDRFEEFATLLYEYLKAHGGDVCMSITDERYIQRARKDVELHRARMAELVALGKIKGRILASAGNLKSGWAELRRQELPKDMPQVSFYAFGDNLALISFEHSNPPYVVLHKSGPFAAAYRAAFEAAWEKAAPVT